MARTRKGTYVLRLDEDEVTLLSALADQLDPLLDDPSADPSLRRLFPPAHPEDVLSEAAWQIERGDALRDSKRASLAALRTPPGEPMSESELIAWMQGVNSVRLVLGERMSVSDDPDLEGKMLDDAIARAKGGDLDDAATAREYLGAWQLYEFLGSLVGNAVQALGDPTPPDDR